MTKKAKFPGGSGKLKNDEKTEVLNTYIALMRSLTLNERPKFQGGSGKLKNDEKLRF